MNESILDIAILPMFPIYSVRLFKLNINEHVSFFLWMGITKVIYLNYKHKHTNMWNTVSSFLKFPRHIKRGTSHEQTRRSTTEQSQGN